MGGERRTVAGRVAMDQFVVDLGGATRAGDRGLSSGRATREPTAEDWADAADTIAYEIVTRIGHGYPASM